MLHRSILLGWVVFAAISSAQAEQICLDDVIKASAPDSRYRDNGDQTVTDLWTRLIWKRCPEGLSGTSCTIGTPRRFTWQQALQHAASNAPWRLPNKKELASLVEQSCYNPAINSRFFPNTESGSFWSSSPKADNSGYSGEAWEADLHSGFVGALDKSYQLQARLVRGGQ